jgi:Icc-related predicted phosphoesterase
MKKSKAKVLTCNLCDGEFPVSSFPIIKWNKNGSESRRKQCRECFNAVRRGKASPILMYNPEDVAFNRSPKNAILNKLQEIVGAKKSIEDDEYDWASSDPERLISIKEKFGTETRMKKVLFIPDTHVPYHDVKKFKLMIRAAKAFKPEILIIGGDFADFYQVSSHSKDPSRRITMKGELEAVHLALHQLNEIPGVKRKIYIAGNHEDRFDRYIASRASELSGLINIQNALKLGELGWEYVPYKSHFELGKLFVTHDCGDAGADAHRKAQATFAGNVVINHTHRIGYTVVGNAQGKPHVGAMFGWLGDTEQVDYMHKVKVSTMWAHGFGIGYVRDNGIVHLFPVPIVADSVVIEGRLIK